MEYRRVGNQIAVRLDRGEEVMACLKKLAETENIQSAFVQGLGAADEATFGLYDVRAQKFNSHTVREPLEIASLTGNLTGKDGLPYLHLHIVLGKEDGTAIGGHLISAHISGTAEISVTVLDVAIGRKTDPLGTGLQVFDF